MARFVHKEQSGIRMDYVNVPDTADRSHAQDPGATAKVHGRKLYRLVAVSFGLLCLLQAALNISLRLALFSKTPDKEAGCRNWTAKSEELKRKLIDFDNYFQKGWVFVRPSFYYISTVKKSWQASRDDCLQRGADLVIINSKEEQVFTGHFHKTTWIGLTEGETKGSWKWVDGTPLTTSYWGPEEPNDYEGRQEDCVQLWFYGMENNWNDIPCDDQNFWICEKIVDL